MLNQSQNSETFIIKRVQSYQRRGMSETCLTVFALIKDWPACRALQWKDVKATRHPFSLYLLCSLYLRKYSIKTIYAKNRQKVPHNMVWTDLEYMLAYFLKIGKTPPKSTLFLDSDRKILGMFIFITTNGAYY